MLHCSSLATVPLLLTDHTTIAFLYLPYDPFALPFACLLLPTLQTRLAPFPAFVHTALFTFTATPLLLQQRLAHCPLPTPFFALQPPPPDPTVACRAAFAPCLPTTARAPPTPPPLPPSYKQHRRLRRTLPSTAPVARCRRRRRTPAPGKTGSARQRPPLAPRASRGGRLPCHTAATPAAFPSPLALPQHPTLLLQHMTHYAPAHLPPRLTCVTCHLGPCACLPPLLTRRPPLRRHATFFPVLVLLPYHPYR